MKFHLKDLSPKTMDEGIKIAERYANNILDSLGLLGKRYDYKELYKAVCDDLKSMNFVIKYTDDTLLHVDKITPDSLVKRIVPSITTFKDPADRTKGGQIAIYNKYLKEAQILALYHEYVHIKDKDLPILSTNMKEAYASTMFKEDILKLIEGQVELTCMALIMPIDQLLDDLISFSYDILSVINKYKVYGISTILGWITMIDIFSGHFASISISRDNQGIKKLTKLDEYNQYTGACVFDIDLVIADNSTVAYKCLHDEKNVKGGSCVDGKEYYCFAFYEKSIHQPIYIDEVIDSSIMYDHMTIIGWPKRIWNVTRRICLKSEDNR